MKKILIVVDMQNDFIDGALGTEKGSGCDRTEGRREDPQF